MAVTRDEPGRHRAGRAADALGRGRPRSDDDTDVLPVIGTGPDGPATGLAKFDLGTIPASVTPPSSWRRAAWFAVTAAVMVVVGLTYAAVTLMSGPRRPDVIEALPGLPSGLPLPFTDVAPERTVAPPPAPESSARAVTATTTTPPPEALTAASEPPGTARAEEPGPTSESPSSEQTSEDPVARSKPSTATRSTVVTPMLVVVPNDATAMGDRTEAYYRAVTHDPDAAYALTSGQLRRGGQDQIAQRYAEVDRVEVQQLVIDPARARTRAVLRVVGKDGSVTTETRELTFSHGADPRITAEKETS
ncbi:hypothetical protein [Actinokineospora sp. NBRC 105648]|uniref:hypothetical protein n=1 Tax=Actinokineospora sp. NBRC 105648 TaxID=3032206 RepID=UPI0024A3C870|nr:hypothetical protein [Actinokineospora sp. NBRC 105648]GLZ42052.1 hypothetical protein Acsp05_56760 [Actinokineospora sp. NBRC 105648]